MPTRRHTPLCSIFFSLLKAASITAPGRELLHQSMTSACHVPLPHCAHQWHTSLLGSKHGDALIAVNVRGCHSGRTASLLPGPQLAGCGLRRTQLTAAVCAARPLSLLGYALGGCIAGRAARATVWQCEHKQFVLIRNLAPSVYEPARLFQSDHTLVFPKKPWQGDQPREGCHSKLSTAP